MPVVLSGSGPLAVGWYCSGVGAMFAAAHLFCQGCCSGGYQDRAYCEGCGHHGGEDESLWLDACDGCSEDSYDDDEDCQCCDQCSAGDGDSDCPTVIFHDVGFLCTFGVGGILGTVLEFLRRALMAFLGLGRPRSPKRPHIAVTARICILYRDFSARSDSRFGVLNRRLFFVCSDCLGQRGHLSVRGLVFARIPVFPSWRRIVARPIAETFRESVRHVDFFENDLVLTEDVAMPDSEAGLEYSAYVVGLFK